MCCCKTPSINGQVNAYSWDGKHFGTREPNAPDLTDGDELIWDLPGRCGGVDSHCHHFRVVKGRYGDCALLVRHGGGDERLPLGRDGRIVGPLQILDDGTRYFFVMRFYHLMTGEIRKAEAKIRSEERRAFAEGRMKKRRKHGQTYVEVLAHA